MTTRHHFIVVFFLILLIYGCESETPPHKVYEVVVVGGGASGTMAGIQSARLGSSTLIIEETPWLGGMLTSAGVSAIDGNYKLYSGLWQEFREKIYAYYGGADSVKTGWVSNVLFEPNVGAELLKQMAMEENHLSVWHQSKVVSLEYLDDFWKLKIISEDHEKTIRAAIVIDATELGDISKMVGIEYSIGMDSRLDTKEEIAPLKANDIIQDMTYVAILKTYDNEDHVLEKPKGYDPSLFFCTCVGTCDQDTISRKLWECNTMMEYGKLPNNRYMINWPIYGNDYYLNTIELSEVERKNAFEEAKWFTKCYVYYVQNGLGFKHLGIADDVFPTEDGFPFYPYYRESRRIKGIVRFDINDLSRPFEQSDALYRTGIAVGDYPIDHHHEAYQGKEELPDLHFYPVPSYSLPLGSLIPKNVKNFIVAEKSISVTNLVNGTTRLQPVCLLIGQAAGSLAHLSVEKNNTPKDIQVRDVQDFLIQSNAYIMPYSDVDPADKTFQAIQRIGATGILKGEGKNIGWENHTLFHPDSLLTLKALSDGLKDFGMDLGFNSSDDFITISKTVDILQNVKSEFKKGIVTQDMVQIKELDRIWSDFEFGELNQNTYISRKEFAVLLDEMVDPFHLRQIDHFGMFID